METTMQEIPCGNCIFYNNFDSANLAKVEPVKQLDTTKGDGKSPKTNDNTPDYEFNIWTKHDCQGTEYQNTNRTWFYFGIKTPTAGSLVKLNILNLNKQSKMFSQGMCPVIKVVPGQQNWERIRDKPSYNMDQKGSEFTLSFTIKTTDNLKAITFLAFTYPFTYTELQNYLNNIDTKIIQDSNNTIKNSDSIYYHRECAIKSLEDRRLDVITISSHHNITTEYEDDLNGLYPLKNEKRSLKFNGKRIVFISARVHPGETPSSFVFNGFLNFLLNNDDQIAILLRRIYVFKLIPMLNPDGVARGHYRMDTRGVNLNRVYLDPSPIDHPTIFAARNLIRYYHNFYQVIEDVKNVSMDIKVNENDNEKIQESNGICSQSLDNNVDDENIDDSCCYKNISTIVGVDNNCKKNSEDSGIYLYVDLHGHASKKGVFMYGNYFDDPDDTIMCMLLPKLMSINNSNFHFTSCNFAERNMYLIDKRDGMSREGSGRVAVYKMTGLIRSYTLECNYNSGRLVNNVPARVRDGIAKLQSHMFVPPKYTPTVFEEVGAALGPSILDMTNSNPNSRLPNSQYRSLRGVKSYLKLTYVNSLTGSISRPRLKPMSNADNLGILKEATNSEEYINVINNSSINQDTPKKKLSLKKKMQNTVALYTAVKRIKSGRKQIQQLSDNPNVTEKLSEIGKTTDENNIEITTINRKNKFNKTEYKEIENITKNNETGNWRIIKDNEQRGIIEKTNEITDISKIKKTNSKERQTNLIPNQWENLNVPIFLQCVII
ncbi:cytosolic carboxypeptidase-like protein 5 isoform X2 [Aphidius gifuensis]|uniref:cytosolic carboxypeptidase-like protein 5 isoform X2 n=1 Tax=Aphidius gifuensis TaxID=684658 RepID=UPI001CDCA258|nr:cytosolic carboxypeptidase-like protein 5 isoform X2 [Aphidius gifuensis]